MERSVDIIDLFSPVTALKGVGPARARQLEKLGIFTLYDLIAFFPRGYEDRTKRVAIAALEPDVPACFEAMVISQPTTAYIRRGMELTRVRVADETGQLTLSWFNQSYRKNQLVYGESFLAGNEHVIVGNVLLLRIGQCGISRAGLSDLRTAAAGDGLNAASRAQCCFYESHFLFSLSLLTMPTDLPPQEYECR